MPTRPYTMSEIDDSKILATMGEMLLQCDDEDADLAAFACFGAAAEPLVKRQKQNIGKEHFSLARLRREAAEKGFDGDDVSRNIYQAFGFRLSDLPVVAVVGFQGRFCTFYAGRHGCVDSTRSTQNVLSGNLFSRRFQIERFPERAAKTLELSGINVDYNSDFEAVHRGEIWQSSLQFS